MKGTGNRGTIEIGIKFIETFGTDKDKMLIFYSDDCNSEKKTYLFNSFICYFQRCSRHKS